MDQKMSERVDLLEQWIKESDNVVFFGGAGVSTESGIPDFRSVDGLYNQQYRKPSSATVFTGRTRKSFTGFTKTKCCSRMRSRMQHTRHWLNWSSRARCVQ